MSTKKHNAVLNGSIRAVFPEATDEQIAALSEKFDTELSKVQEDRDHQINQLTTQIKAANEQIAEFEKVDVESIKKSAEEWRTKYEDGTKQAAEKLAALRYQTALKELVSELKFSSNSAKKAFLADVTAKNLPLEGEKITGFNDFVKEYEESDPDAFVQPEPPQPAKEKPAPVVTPVPSGARTEHVEATNYLTEAQRLFAQKGINFDQIKNFGRQNAVNFTSTPTQ
jgi:hypothetical protein